MDVLTAIKERFSVRKYSDRKIEPEKLNAVLEAVKHAPTAVNYQPQKVYVMESEDALAKVKANSKFYFDSPVVLLVCYDVDRAVKVPFMPEGNSGMMDATIVCDEIMLAAWEQGLGSCWVIGFDHEGISRSFNLPENIKPAVLLFLGYAADDCVPFKFHNETRSLEDMVTRL